jgi:hypothetical protein
MASDNYDDAAILDITSIDDESALLLNDNSQITSIDNVNSSIHDIIRVPSISHFRLTNILRGLVFLEFLLLSVIWLTGISISIKSDIFLRNFRQSDSFTHQ